jgi:hypothetical protein
MQISRTIVQIQGHEKALFDEGVLSYFHCKNPVRIQVRIDVGPQHHLANFKRQLIVRVLRMTAKKKRSPVSQQDLVWHDKEHPCSKALSREHIDLDFAALHR